MSNLPPILYVLCVSNLHENTLRDARFSSLHKSFRPNRHQHYCAPSTICISPNSRFTASHAQECVRVPSLLVTIKVNCFCNLAENGKWQIMNLTCKELKNFNREIVFPSISSSLFAKLCAMYLAGTHSLTQMLVNVVDEYSQNQIGCTTSARGAYSVSRIQNRK